MPILVAVTVAAVLVAATVLVHYEVLRAISRLIPHLTSPARTRVLFVIAGVLIAHTLEVGLYALAFAALQAMHIGSIGGQSVSSALDFFYFSITSYTTLGVGDLIPHGPLRVVAGMEALNGFVLIGWSASFTYLAMEKLWNPEPS